MGKVFLAGFKAGRGRYEHTMDTSINETYVNAIDNSDTIFRTNEGGWTYNKHGAIAGRFVKMESGCYYYKTIDSSTRLNTKFRDLLEAQRDVFSVLLSFGYKE